MDLNEADLQRMFEELLPQVMEKVAKQHRLQFVTLSEKGNRLLQRMVRRAVSDPRLLSLVSDQITAAVGLNQNLVEMKLHSILSRTMRRFLLLCYISQ